MMGEVYRKAHAAIKRIQWMRRSLGKKLKRSGTNLSNVTSAQKKDWVSSSEEGRLFRGQKQAVKSYYTKPQFSMKISQIKTIINILTKQIISHVILPTFITKFKNTYP